MTRLPRRDDRDNITAPDTVTPAELKSLLGWLGLPREWFAERCKVSRRQVIRWEDGDTPISETASAEIVRIWNEATAKIIDIVNTSTTKQGSSPDGVITLRTYRVDDDCTNTGYPATYHRALVCRAMDHLLMRTRYRVQILWAEA
ncbi:MAG TPA: hypothetical protein VJ777_30205 [Mycobacterium sp.]|nr:hypothetical protein [Mycobacterium sp.]